MPLALEAFDEVYETMPGNGWLYREEARLLWDSVNETTGTILEVGPYQGRSTVLLAATGRIVYAVDPFDDFHSDLKGDDIHRLLLDNLWSRGIENVFIYRQRIEDWEPLCCGFAYLDGDHTYEGTRRQIAKALKCYPQRVAIHDVNDSGGGLYVKKAALGMLGPWTQRVERLAIWNLIV